jgi:prepilin-type N-terminal cleavage/methylation domain-containing protein
VISDFRLSISDCRLGRLRKSCARQIGNRKSEIGNPNSGFTLLEVLIAMAVSLLLLGAVYAALDMHWKYSTKGRDEVVRAQIVRAVFQRMQLDIRSVVYPPPAASDAAQTAGTSGTSGTTSGSGTVSAGGVTVDTANQSVSVSMDSTDTSESFTQTTVGVIGDSTTLMLHVSRPNRHLNYSSVLDGQNMQSRSSDLVSVAYFEASSGGSGLQGLVGSRLGGGASGTNHGLARLEGDRLVMNLADSQGNMDALAAQTELLAPEVTDLRFFYFDGAEWLTEWDSSALGALPRAIQIEMVVDKQVYTLIVAVPMAKAATSTSTSTSSGS